MTSNLSKIKPKLRTTGQVTGNFGKTKVKAGSNMKDIGFSTKDNIQVVREKDYIARLYDALDVTDDPKLKKFLYTEIKKYLVKTNQWGEV